MHRSAIAFDDYVHLTGHAGTYRKLARQDLRSDLPNSDILKTYPLAGWQVLLGETLTPVVILTGLVWLALLAAALALGPRAATIAWLTPGFRLTAGLCAAATVPVLCALQLIIPNAAALLFPAWFQATRQIAQEEPANSAGFSFAHSFKPEGPGGMWTLAARRDQDCSLAHGSSIVAAIPTYQGFARIIRHRRIPVGLLSL